MAFLPFARPDITEAEIEAIRKLESLGVRVYYQLVPEQQVIEAKTYI